MSDGANHSASVTVAVRERPRQDRNAHWRDVPLSGEEPHLPLAANPIDSLSGALASGEPPQIAYLRRGGLR